MSSNKKNFKSEMFVRRPKSKDRRSRNRSQPSLDHPRMITGNLPVIENKPKQVRCFRYTCLNGADFAIGTHDLLSILTTVDSATTGKTVIESFKIEYIRFIFTPDSTQNGEATFLWTGDRNPSSSRSMVFAPGNSYKVTFHPPEHSLSSFWFDGTIDEDLFSVVSSNADFYMDIHATYVLHQDDTQALTLVSAGARSGLCLANLPNSSYLLTPTGYTGVNVVTW